MPRAAKWIASVGGLGHMPWAPGTMGSLAGWLLGIALSPSPKDSASVPWILLMALVIMWGVGVAAGTMAEGDAAQRDPSWIVIDELCGMWTVLVLMPLARLWPISLVAFALFRLFDIVKPFPLKWLARLPGGWGIMADDLGAALYTLGIFVLWLSLVRLPR